jgi:ribosomal protein S21
MKVLKKGHESAISMCKRLRKMMEKSGHVYELRKKEFYVKPSERRRRKELRKKIAIKNGDNGKHTVVLE